MHPKITNLLICLFAYHLYFSGCKEIQINIRSRFVLQLHLFQESVLIQLCFSYSCVSCNTLPHSFCTRFIVAYVHLLALSSYKDTKPSLLLRYCRIINCYTSLLSEGLYGCRYHFGFLRENSGRQDTTSRRRN